MSIEDIDTIPERAGEAAAALSALKGPAEDAGRAIEQAFERAGSSLTRSLGRAASDGRVTLDELAEAAIRAFSALATVGGVGGKASGGLAEALAAAVKGFGGARADGGPVLASGSYLVGERGPEVFRPSGAGSVEPLGAAGGMTVNVTVQGGGGAGALVRSEAQIAQALARAAMLGARRL